MGRMEEIWPNPQGNQFLKKELRFNPKREALLMGSLNLKPIIVKPNAQGAQNFLRGKK